MTETEAHPWAWAEDHWRRAFAPLVAAGYQLERVESVIRTGRGPQDVASDAGFMDGEPYAFLYVGHFTDSYMGVVDMDMRRSATYAQVVANFGTPTPPKEER